MVKEVYCSYELSKLLKEKGFEISTPNSIPCVYYDYKNRIYGYTHQNVMKWLREEKKIIIEISYNKAAMLGTFINFTFSAVNINKGEEHIHLENYDTYEEATEKSIMYVIENGWID